MRNSKGRYMRRDERIRAIVNAALGHRQVGTKTFTVYKMAKWLGMSPSTHLRKIMMELEQAGVLELRVEAHRANVEKAVFRLSDAALFEMAML